ncbi:hypothetical protein EJ08DRAFT_668584 [Tothia fuscella]|uniref:Uncharacterized protein n=1 Tax=Tothia fuscella TaxID=1048955 RepID=A0A9P4NY84_9PEZI|nr:hypothetical protein EJ08DRAFT_668584 [Tothia fuscella]
MPVTMQRADPNILYNLQTTSNGFVETVIKAYSSHRHLTLRPEDVWLAVLTQFNSYVNAHAEELRPQFVGHGGKKELVLRYGGERTTFNFGRFANDMGSLLQKNIVDPELRDWLLPCFSTTTRHDIVVGSIVMMSSMQSYFGYECRVECAKIEKLTTFGEEPTKFHSLLKPVLAGFVQSFDEPNSAEIISFCSIYSGWITAFCFWDDKGKCLYRDPLLTTYEYEDESQVFDDEDDNFGLSDTDLPRSTPSRDLVGTKKMPHLKLDGVAYHLLESDQTPSGYSTVPVTIVENGVTYQTVMGAGLIGMRAISSGDVDSMSTGLDSLVPQSAW